MPRLVCRVCGGKGVAKWGGGEGHSWQMTLIQLGLKAHPRLLQEYTSSLQCHHHSTALQAVQKVIALQSAGDRPWCHTVLGLRWSSFMRRDALPADDTHTLRRAQDLLQFGKQDVNLENT